MPVKTTEKPQGIVSVWGKTIDRDKMAAMLEQTLRELPLRRVILLENGESRPPAESEVTIVRSPRLIQVRSGQMGIEGFLNGVRSEQVINPGEAVYCPAYAWTKTHWERHHEIVSLVFYDTCLRALYVNHQTCQPFPLPDFYFNTDRPINVKGFHLLQCINLITDAPEHQPEVLRLLLQALMWLALQDIKDSHPVVYSRAEQTRRQILDYIQSNCHRAINRENTAKILHLSPTYLSRTLYRHDGKSFNVHLTEARMQLAQELLERHEFTIDEIAYQCGYRYTSYFIAVFKKLHGITPCEYRTRLYSGPTP